MASTVTRNWNLLLRTENNVTRVYYYGYDKNDLFINSYLDLSQSIMYSGYTDTYMLEQFILPALNSAISDINLTIPNINNYLSGNSNSDNYYVGSLQNNDRLTSCKLMCITLSQTVIHTDVESVDYTNILTSINTNLTNLNTNIQNKNNQSDIVDCLNNIFCYSTSDNLTISAIKDSHNDGYSSVYLKKANLTNMFRQLVRMFSTVNVDYDTSISLSNQILDNISKKLSIDVPIDSGGSSMFNRSIRQLIYGIFRTLTGTENINQIGANSGLFQISNKLANSNDLHTISQAIDLISTAIAQTPTTDTTGLQTELGKISTAVNNIENNPLFELNANVNGIEVCKKNNKNELDF